MREIQMSACSTSRQKVSAVQKVYVEFRGLYVNLLELEKKETELLILKVFTEQSDQKLNRQRTLNNFLNQRNKSNSIIV